MIYNVPLACCCGRCSYSENVPLRLISEWKPSSGDKDAWCFREGNELQKHNCLPVCEQRFSDLSLVQWWGQSFSISKFSRVCLICSCWAVSDWICDVFSGAAWKKTARGLRVYVVDSQTSIAIFRLTIVAINWHKLLPFLVWDIFRVLCVVNYFFWETLDPHFITSLSELSQEVCWTQIFYGQLLFVSTTQLEDGKETLTIYTVLHESSVTPCFLDAPEDE